MGFLLPLDVDLIWPRSHTASCSCHVCCALGKIFVTATSGCLKLDKNWSKIKQTNRYEIRAAVA